MHPLREVRSVEWQRTSEQLIEGDTDRVEITSRVDRTVHPPRLLGRHVCRGAAHREGGFRPSTFTRDRGRNRQPGKPHRVGLSVDQDVSGLEILVNEALTMQTPDRDGELNCDT